jgi:hypothetical protein
MTSQKTAFSMSVMYVFGAVFTALTLKPFVSVGVCETGSVSGGVVGLKFTFSFELSSL